MSPAATKNGKTGKTNGSEAQMKQLAEQMPGIAPKQLMDMFGLGQSGTMLVSDDDIRYHDDPNEKSIAVPQGMAMEHLAEVAKKKAAELNKVHTFNHWTDYRPDDGAHAASLVIKRMFGLTVGQATKHMFGEDPPEFRTINIAHNKKMEVPWGRLEIPALPGAVFIFAGSQTKDKGPVFVIQAESPKKHKAQIEAFFAAVDEELRTNSIYRGKPLIGAHELKFMNVGTFKSDQIVFSDDVQRTLDAALFGLVEHTAATVDAGLPTKRAVLAFGPYGTGKSSLGLIAAQRATNAGWTFLSAKAGRDQLRPVLQTAALYEPAVVFVEDIDAHTPKAEDTDGISELLDLFDGIGTKNSRLCVVMTTNHIEKVPAGMLRPGRLDYCVEINGLDRGGVERLVKAVVPNRLLNTEVDYDAVFEQMSDWQPAWVRAAADRAQSFAIARTGGALSYELTTDDLINAATSLGPQLKLMGEALEGYITPEFTDTFSRTVTGAVNKAVDKLAVVDRDHDQMYALEREPAGFTWDSQ